MRAPAAGDRLMAQADKVREILAWLKRHGAVDRKGRASRADESNGAAEAGGAKISLKRLPGHVSIPGIPGVFMNRAGPLVALFVTLAVSLSARPAATQASAAQQAAPPPVQEPTKPSPPAPKPLVAMSPDGTRIVYEVTGSGPAVMLLHGGGQTRRSWNDAGYVDRLSKHFTVITVDLRGGGDSDKPDTLDAYALERVLADLLSVADAASAKRFHVWGFGHGASIARYLAARSDRVMSAVLVSATMGPTVTGIAKDAMVAMRERWQSLLDAKRTGTLDVKTLSPGDRAALEGGMAVNAIALGALVDYPPLEPSDINAPTLWVLGADDASAIENRKIYEPKLAGTKVTLKVLPSTGYSDSFFKIEPVFEVVEPFLGMKSLRMTSEVDFPKTENDPEVISRQSASDAEPSSCRPRFQPSTGTGQAVIAKPGRPGRHRRGGSC